MWRTTAAGTVVGAAAVRAARRTPSPVTAGVRPGGACRTPAPAGAAVRRPGERGRAVTTPDGGATRAAPAMEEEGVARTAPPRKEAARPARRGPADPVRSLMHHHQELCARAVDALEIAAGLEAHGVTDRTAARFRHRDVFSLAEELYARVPRADPATTPAAAPEAGGRARRRPGLPERARGAAPAARRRLRRGGGRPRLGRHGPCRRMYRRRRRGRGAGRPRRPAGRPVRTAATTPPGRRTADHAACGSAGRPGTRCTATGCCGNCW